MVQEISAVQYVSLSEYSSGEHQSNPHAPSMHRAIILSLIVARFSHRLIWRKPSNYGLHLILWKPFNVSLKFSYIVNDSSNFHCYQFRLLNIIQQCRFSSWYCPHNCSSHPRSMVSSAIFISSVSCEWLLERKSGSEVAGNALLQSCNHAHFQILCQTIFPNNETT